MPSSPSPPHPSSDNNRKISPLVTTTHAFISAFVSNRSSSEILDTYFAPDAEIHEHGPEGARERLPFLAKTFRGRCSSSSSSLPPLKVGEQEEGETLDDYYRLLEQ
ncbi:MAG: hypothetical protein Q9181_006574, partial [Wetmoreana brouardii]